MYCLGTWYNTLFPAYAGVIPSEGEMKMFITAFPRVCGGDPELDRLPFEQINFSPRMRG